MYKNFILEIEDDKYYRVEKYRPDLDRWISYGRNLGEDVKSIVKGFKQDKSLAELGNGREVYYTRKNSQIMYAVAIDY